MSHLQRLAAICLISLCLTHCRLASKSQQEFVHLPSLGTLVASKTAPDYLRPDSRGREVWQIAKRFYQTNGFRAAWTANRKPLGQMDDLIFVVQAAGRDGLDPRHYDAEALARAREALWNRETRQEWNERRLAELDLRLTCTYLEYAADVAGGRADPRDIDQHWVASPRKIDLAAALQRVLDEERVKQALLDSAPQHAEYLALREVLSNYRDIEAKGGWPAMAAVKQLKPGARSPVVPALRQRLAITGDYKGRDATSPVFDDELAAALGNFETRHGLEADGVLDSAAVAAMNIPVGQRIRQIELNMERWRWLPDDLGARHIRVNIPTFRLDLMENGRPALTSRVIVGETDNRTPIFSDVMQYVVFSPYWNIPPEILRTETLPRAMQDPGFLARNNIEVVRAGGSGEAIDPSSIDWNDRSLVFRQRPGAGNSLGLVKFVFPNHFNVYLHDTPADALFQKIERDFSHGCVRVEQPFDLARAVLRDQSEWTDERIDAAMRAGTERTVPLKQAIPVHLLYFTVLTFDNGAVQFRDDIYGYDRAHERLLAR